MYIPYLDLKTQYAGIREDILDAINDVLDSCTYISGPAVDHFETAFAEFCEARECVALGSGTDAIHLALLALGVGPGDEVITQANTFIATLAAIAYTGARPVLVDVIEPTYTIDMDAVRAAIGPKTKAIMPVHLYGQPADVESLESICQDAGIALVHDAAQAHGATWAGRSVGAARMTCFSFYPGKNLGAYGEGGAVTTSDEKLAAAMRKLRSHGSDKRYHHDVLGYNYRMDGIQGAVLNVKLRHLATWIERRREIGRIYDSLLSNVCKPLVPSGSGHVYHIYPIYVSERDRIAASLARRGIETNTHYPVPCHLQPAFAWLGYSKGRFPVSEWISERELSLPIYPEMTGDAATFVANNLQESIAESAV